MLNGLPNATYSVKGVSDASEDYDLLFKNNDQQLGTFIINNKNEIGITFNAG
jgi:hypothetical protein